MLIGLSQRVENFQKSGEIRDCLDQRWSKLMATFGHMVIPIPNNPEITADFITRTGIEGLVLTGGNDLSSLNGAVNSSIDRDKTERIIVSHGLHLGLPILGVCRGLQFINDFFGGSLSTARDHVAVDHQISFNSKKFGSIDSIEVNSFHNYAIGERDLAAPLVPFAFADDGTIEGAYHSKLSCMGVMWHPERSESEIDERILKYIFK